jgi:CubicO group peptidase (beta-lactamase class C family)
MPHRRKFIQQMGLNAAGAILLPSLPAFIRPFQPASTTRLPRSTPEAQGIASAAIIDWLDAIRTSNQEFHSIMIIRNGYVVAEGWWYPYAPQLKHDLYSGSKSFTGTAIGLAADEKRLSIEDAVVSFFPKDRPAGISPNLAALKIKHLLSMSVGMEKDAILTIEKTPPGETWEKTFLSLPIGYEPGSRFLYNSGASYMLSSIVKQATGMSAHEWLRPRIYEPLGITGATWTENVEGVNMGASHLRIATEDFAKLGQLYLQEGRWGDKQLLSKEWVALATKKEIETGKNDSSWGYGYGYQFWRNPTGGFRADGAYGQYSMVFPDKQLVVAILSESADKAATMQTVWDHLYPAIKENHPLAANQSTHNSLLHRLKSLSYRPPQANRSSALSARLSGKAFLLDPNPFQAKAVSFRFNRNTTVFTVMEEGKPDIVITCGMNEWIVDGNRKPSAHSLFSLRRIDFDSVVAASATWTDDHSLVLTFRFIETVHGDTLTCIFDGDKLRIQFLFSASRLEKHPDERADVTGKLV